MTRISPQASAHPFHRNLLPRRGLTLLEVIIALAIFLFALAALNQLLNLSSERAVSARQQQRAAFLCQSKLAEIAAGAEPLTSQTGVIIQKDANWDWSSECSEADVTGLWKVQVRVSQQRAGGRRIEVAMSQLLLDPAQRGSTSDTSATTRSSDSSDTSGSSSSSSSSGGS